MVLYMFIYDKKIYIVVYEMECKRLYKCLQRNMPGFVENIRKYVRIAQK